MAIDRNELRRVMGHFATGVTVVTTRDRGGRHYGLTANAVCSLSLSPPLLLVCVDKRAESHAAFAESGVFVVNILRDAQKELSQRFAVSGGEKFVGVDFRTGATGAAILGDSLGWIECRVVEVHEGGDHTIYVGEAQAADAAAGAPLLFFRGRYGDLRQD